MADPRTFTEDEHTLLLTAAVQQETAALTASKQALESEKAELQTKLDLVEAEKATAIGERDTVTAAFDQYKTDLTEMAACSAREEERVAAVKEKAKHLPEDYFTPERAQRWAGMSPELFESAVADLVATAPGSAPAGTPAVETAAFTGGQVPNGGKQEARSNMSKLLAPAPVK